MGTEKYIIFRSGSTYNHQTSYEGEETMIYREPHDTNDPAELRRAADRLYHRLERFGYRLQRGRTVKSAEHHIQLKRGPVQRGFKVTDIATGQVVCGEGFTATLQQINQFWEKEAARRWKEKIAAEGQKQRERAETELKERGLW